MSNINNMKAQIKLQVGMQVVIKDSVSEYGKYAGKTKIITAEGKLTGSNIRTFELDGNEAELWIIKDFKYAVGHSRKTMI